MTRKTNITPMMPYLMRATWSNVRQPFTVWKVWTEVELANGRRLMINTNGWCFRVSGVEGEYYLRREDVEKFEAAYRKVFNQPK